MHILRDILGLLGNIEARRLEGDADILVVLPPLDYLLLALRRTAALRWLSSAPAIPKNLGCGHRMCFQHWRQDSVTCLVGSSVFRILRARMCSTMLSLVRCTTTVLT